MDYSGYKDLKVRTLEPGVLEIVMGEEGKLAVAAANAHAEMARIWLDVDRDPGARVAILRGAGKGFSAGMDLRAFVQGQRPFVEGRGFAGIVQKAARKPLIAAVEGFAVAGGFEIALACDLIVAAKGARFGIPEVKVGLFAGAGGLLRIPQRVPYGIAMELALTGDPIDADTALRLGIVSRVVPSDELHAAAADLAGRIIRNAPLAVEAVKELALRALDMPWEPVSRLSELYRALIGTTEDAKEGPRAFVEKREPVYRGR